MKGVPEIWYNFLVLKKNWEKNCKNQGNLEQKSLVFSKKNQCKKKTYTLLNTIISTQCNHNIEENKTEASKHHFKIVINGTIDSIVIAENEI